MEFLVLNPVEITVENKDMELFQDMKIFQCRTLSTRYSATILMPQL